MTFRRGALAGAAVAAALAVTGCAWNETTSSVRIGPSTAAPASGEGRTRVQSPGFGVPPSFGVDLAPTPSPTAAARDDSPQPPAVDTVPATVPVTSVPVPVIPTRGARLDELAVAAVIPPVAVRIPAHGVSNTVIPVGVDAGTGELSVPLDPAEVGWYQFGSTPGAAGSAVLAGHVDWKGRPGAFIDLDQVQPGERVEVDLADGTTHAFVVVETHLIAKTELPKELFERSGPPKLVLITCGGEFDRSIHRYRQNVVVVATPA